MQLSDPNFNFRSLDSLEGMPEPKAVEAKAVAKPTIAARARLYMPGLVIAGLVAMAASWLSEHYTAPVMLFALLLGIAVNFTAQDARCKPGLDFAARQILRIGVALLGMRITFDQIQSLGLGVLALAATGVCLTILVGWRMARAVKLESKLGVLMGGAVAICGASAALAISAVLPKGPTHERDTILTVVGVTTLSTIAMVLYPILTAALGFDERMAGIFFGATIHDVAQVVGAGGVVGDEAQNTATVMKLFRVALLLPAVLVISYLFRNAHEGAAAVKRPPLLPMFLIAFGILVAINTLNFVPAPITGFLQEASRWCLVTAIAALGAKTALGDLVKVGWRPIAVICGTTLFIGLFVLAGLLWLLPA
jgi:uncharacterized integral membrane protein (TIGR00698 family)